MKNKKQKVVTLLSIALLVFAGVKYNGNHNVLLDNSSMDVSKSESGLLIKYLTTSTNQEGYEVISFNYEVLPNEANDKTISISLTWTSSSVDDDISSYLTYSHNQDDFYIEITCLQKANNQAVMTLTSNDNVNATASVYIDFEEEFLGWSNKFTSITKTYTLADDEYLSGEDEFKTELEKLSKGFLGTVSVADKEITNMSYEVSYLNFKVESDDGVIDILQGSGQYGTLLEYVKNYRDPATKTTSKYFANNLGNFINLLSNEEKQIIRNSEEIRILLSYDVSFEYYGESHSLTMYLTEYFPTSHFSESTYVGVNSISTEGNIIFSK